LAALCASAATFVLAVLVLPLGVAWLELGALCAAAGVFYLVHTRSSFAASWRDRLDAQLASYEPLDRGAFEVLQRQATAPGGLDNLHVLAWLSVEREAVRPSAAAPRPWRFAERAGP
jgi:hypothetical protein